MQRTAPCTPRPPDLRGGWRQRWQHCPLLQTLARSAVTRLVGHRYRPATRSGCCPMVLVGGGDKVHQPDDDEHGTTKAAMLTHSIWRGVLMGPVWSCSLRRSWRCSFLGAVNLARDYKTDPKRCRWMARRARSGAHAVMRPLQSQLAVCGCGSVDRVLALKPGSWVRSPPAAPKYPANA